jgi:hypothetical protein
MGTIDIRNAAHEVRYKAALAIDQTRALLIHSKAVTEAFLSLRSELGATVGYISLLRANRTLRSQLHVIDERLIGLLSRVQHLDEELDASGGQSPDDGTAFK